MNLHALYNYQKKTNNKQGHFLSEQDKSIYLKGEKHFSQCIIATVIILKINTSVWSEAEI